MKNITLFFSMVLASASLYAADFSLSCELDLAVAEQKIQCPAVIENALAEMNCGGQTKSCIETSPGAENSGVSCEIVNSTCTLPLVKYQPYCKKNSTLKIFHDYDGYSAHYPSVIRTHEIYGMGIPVDSLCSPN